MARVSIEDAFGWAQRFAAREWRLVLPVALAFVALPPLLVDVAVPDQRWKMLQTGAGVDVSAMMHTAGWLFPLSLAVLLVGGTGGLAITALALVPRISVAEAIGLAFRRLGTLIAALLVIVAGLLLLATAAALLAGAARLDPLSLQAALLGVILGAGLYLSARLLPLGPVIVERRIGPIAALKRSWELTSGVFWRLLGALALYLIGGGIVLLALGTALGAILMVLANGAGAAEAGRVLTAVVLRVVAAAVSAGLHLVVVGLYRQLAVSSSGI